MTTSTPESSSPPAAQPVPGAPSQASPGQLSWLDGELPRWVADGLVTPESAEAIRGRYATSRRFSLVRLAVTLGAVFVAVGLIWLVTANLDRFSPLGRFLLVGVIWLALLIAAETFAARAVEGERGAPLVAGLRLLAVAGYGAVVFQAAHSLQVPLETPSLVGIWAAGALVHGYAVHSVVPPTLGAGLAALWFVLATAQDHGGQRVVALAFLGAALVAVGVGLLHEARWWPEVSLPWREIGAALVLVGTFVAGLPRSWREVGFPWLVWVGLGLGVVAAFVALAVTSRIGRLEAGLALVGSAAGLLLVLWGGDAPDYSSENHWSTVALLRSLVAVLLYLLVAIGYAVLGTLRGSWRITVLALVGLTAFITSQAFEVFAQILSGASLFILVGVVLIGTGLLADRGRRRLAAEAREALL